MKNQKEDLGVDNMDYLDLLSESTGDYFEDYFISKEELKEEKENEFNSER